MIFAAALVPMLGLMGGAIDYGRSVVDKTVLDSALDNAAIVAAKAAQDADAKGLQSAEMAVYAQTMALKAFNGTPKLPANTTPVIRVTVNNRSVTVTADYTSKTTTTLLKVVGFDRIDLSGHAESVVDLSPMVDIYLLIDVSGSMALGATQTDIDRLNAAFGCAFACHDGVKVKNSIYDAYEWAVLNGITLRTQEINKGIIDFVNWLTTQASASKRIRIASYSFSNDLTKLVNTTSTLSLAVTNLPQAPNTSNEYAGATHFKEIMPGFASEVGKAGDGKTSPKKLVIIATDGVQDPSRAWIWDVPKRAEVAPFAPASCRLIDSSVSVSVLYAPYLKLSYDWGYQATLGAPSQIWGGGTRFDDIVPQLTRCASTPDLFVNAATTPSIGSAFVSIFQKFTQIRLAR
ncbi:Tad domain-containing protein [Methylobacterium marchantiae]|uniref:Tad domain-containing protein n=1 Tax=Methylobacterium marchantiae TaxID=600331 RepID=A0ABW3X2K9_9HYPH